MKNITLAVLAHVDAGKTTLVEAILYHAGILKQPGRVDHRTSFLDYGEEERKRGITITDKTVRFNYRDTAFTIIDTPGHVDFSGEMERALSVIDAAVVIVNAQNGFQSHTGTVLKLLMEYRKPIFFFVNKTDQNALPASALLAEIRSETEGKAIDFTGDSLFEQLALCSDELLEFYAGHGTIDKNQIRHAITDRLCYPVYFGSALKLDGTKQLLDGLEEGTEALPYRSETSGLVYRISYDEGGNRLTHIKVTGGSLKPKQMLGEEKIDQIRAYNGSRYDLLPQADAGTVCALKGIESLEAGSGFGEEDPFRLPLLKSYMAYEIVPEEGGIDRVLLELCRRQAEAEPLLNLKVQSDRIVIHLLGEMQKEMLEESLTRAYGKRILIRPTGVTWRETITSSVTGVGHFEPLRHYAEVMVRLEPGEEGSGIQADSVCPIEHLPAGVQKTLLSYLRNIRWRGVLIGADLTDVRMILTDAKTHPKHTEGGDLKEALIRAVRQGLMQAESVLLEPYVLFEIGIAPQYAAAVLYDLDRKTVEPDVGQTAEQMILKGSGPLRFLNGYEQQLRSLTRGTGTIVFTDVKEKPVADAQAILEQSSYQALADEEQPADSVFCLAGAGRTIPWNEVFDYMHLAYRRPRMGTTESGTVPVLTDEDLERILDASGGKNRNPNKKNEKKQPVVEPKKVIAKPVLPKCLIVDGYNMIYDWPSLAGEKEESFEVARQRLIDELFAYQAWIDSMVILVFDGYRRNDPIQTIEKKGDRMTVVYTRGNVTADQYIQEMVAKMKGQYEMTVATSDQLVQIAVFSQGALRISARELENRILLTRKKLM